MGIVDFFHTLNGADPRPDFLEMIILACSVVAYLAYLCYVLRTGHSKVLSFATLIVTLGMASIWVVKEMVTKKRWFIILQLVILLGMAIYLSMHRWNVYRSELETSGI